MQNQIVAATVESPEEQESRQRPENFLELTTFNQ